MLAMFKNTGERYVDYCKDRKIMISDCIRREFRREHKLLEGDESHDYIYMKLCGNNEILTHQRVNDEELKGFCNVMEQDISVKSLDLRFNLITDAGAKCISELLLRNHVIVELNLMGNNIEEEGAKYIGDSLKKNKSLKILKLTGNKIGCKGAIHIAQALQTNNTLEELDLGDCDLKIQSVIAFSTVLKCNTAIKIINLDRPLLWTQQEETTVHMENMLYNNKTLEELHLAKYEMRDFGMERLCDALIINTSLQILDLSCNRITRDGAKVIAKVLAHNTPLRVLDLSYNLIHDDGLKAISKSLCYCNTNLKSLVLTSNEIGEEGLLEFAAALDINSNLEKFYIWGNTFTSAVCRAFMKLMENFRIMESQVDVRPYMVDGECFFSYLPHNMEYRMYRYNAPIYGADVPKNRSYAIM